MEFAEGNEVRGFEGMECEETERGETEREDGMRERKRRVREGFVEGKRILASGMGAESA